MMCPWMHRAVYFTVLRRGWRDDRGDVTPVWTDQGEGVYATVREDPEALQVTEDGTVHPDRLSLSLPWMDRPVMVGDILRTDAGEEWEVLESSVSRINWMGSQRVTVEARR